MTDIQTAWAVVTPDEDIIGLYTTRTQARMEASEYRQVQGARAAVRKASVKVTLL